MPTSVILKNYLYIKLLVYFDFIILYNCMIMYRYLKTIMYRYLKTEGNHVTSQVTTPQYLYLPSFELLYITQLLKLDIC